MVKRLSRCYHCGAPARVRILHGYDEAEPVIRPYCLSCAEAADESAAARDRGSGGYLRFATLLAVCGVGLEAGAVLVLHSGFDALLMSSAGALLLVGAMAFNARLGGPPRRRATAAR